jgi:hypothetical protein
LLKELTDDGQLNRPTPLFLLSNQVN